MAIFDRELGKVKKFRPLFGKRGLAKKSWRRMLYWEIKDNGIRGKDVSSSGCVIILEKKQDCGFRFTFLDSIYSSWNWNPNGC